MHCHYITTRDISLSLSLSSRTTKATIFLFSPQVGFLVLCSCSYYPNPYKEKIFALTTTRIDCISIAAWIHSLPKFSVFLHLLPVSDFIRQEPSGSSNCESFAEIRMPRSRGSELPQRQSPRLRTSAAASDSDNHPPHHHHRPITDRSPKLGLDRRSPRSGGPHSDPLNQKKLGTRIADLESQLGQAQDELRVLKEQLATAEAAKKQAQEELQKKAKKPNNVARVEGPVPGSKTTDRDEVPGDAQPETDVFEVPVEKITIEPKTDQENESKEVEKPKPDGLASKEEEINTLKAKLYDMEKERESLGKENENLKNQLDDTASEMSNVKAKEEEMASKMNQIGKELEETRANAAQLKEKLESTEEAKEELETEMKKLRVQTEQWRKAADAAAAVLAGGVEMNGRVSEKQFTGGLFEAGGGFVGSPGMAEDSDDGFGSGKRKGSGIKKLGDLWKKKGHK